MVLVVVGANQKKLHHDNKQTVGRMMDDFLVETTDASL